MFLWTRNTHVTRLLQVAPDPPGGVEKAYRSTALARGCPSSGTSQDGGCVWKAWPQGLQLSRGGRHAPAMCSDVSGRSVPRAQRRCARTGPAGRVRAAVLRRRGQGQQCGRRAAGAAARARWGGRRRPRCPGAPQLQLPAERDELRAPKRLRVVRGRRPGLQRNRPPLGAQRDELPGVPALRRAAGPVRAARDRERVRAQRPDRGFGGRGQEEQVQMVHVPGPLRHRNALARPGAGSRAVHGLRRSVRQRPRAGPVRSLRGRVCGHGPESREPAVRMSGVRPGAVFGQHGRRVRRVRRQE